jgi:hypothetical protein
MKCGGKISADGERCSVDRSSSSATTIVPMLHSSPSYYRQLMDEDKVDLVIGGYGTHTVLPAMPLIMQRERFQSYDFVDEHRLSRSPEHEESRHHRKAFGCYGPLGPIHARVRT